MKKLFIYLLIVVIAIFVVRCSGTNAPQNQTSDFSILVIMSAPRSDSWAEYGISVFIDSEKEIRISQQKQHSAEGVVLTWNTKSATLTDNELQEFRTLLNKSNIFKLPRSYSCKYLTIEECHVNEPTLQSASIVSIAFNGKGRLKEISMSTSNGMPNSLKEILRKMVSIRDRFWLSSVPWIEQDSNGMLNSWKEIINKMAGKEVVVI